MPDDNHSIFYPDSCCLKRRLDYIYISLALVPLNTTGLSSIS